MNNTTLGNTTFAPTPPPTTSIPALVRASSWVLPVWGGVIVCYALIAIVMFVVIIRGNRVEYEEEIVAPGESSVIDMGNEFNRDDKMMRKRFK